MITCLHMVYCSCGFFGLLLFDPLEIFAYLLETFFLLGQFSRFRNSFRYREFCSVYSGFWKLLVFFSVFFPCVLRAIVTLFQMAPLWFFGMALVWICRVSRSVGLLFWDVHCSATGFFCVFGGCSQVVCLWDLLYSVLWCDFTAPLLNIAFWGVCSTVFGRY